MTFNQQKFFDLPQDAGSRSLAEADLPTAADIGSTLANPAGLGWLAGSGVSAGYIKSAFSGDDPTTDAVLEEDTHAGYALGAAPLGEGILGFGWSGFMNEAEDTLDWEHEQWRLHAAYGQSIDDRLSLGAGLSYHNQSFSSREGREKLDDGLRVGGGGQYRLSDSTTFGLGSAIGVGTNKIERANAGDSENTLLSWTIDAGIAERIGSTLLALAVRHTNYDQEDADDARSENFGVGVEQPLFEMLALRAGYRWSHNRGFTALDTAPVDFHTVSFGAGFRPRKLFTVDYGTDYQTNGNGDWSHIVTLTVPL